MALQLDDRSVDAHRNYGYVLELQGNWSGAIEQYQKALEINPNLAYIHIAIGQNYRALGQLEKALESFDKAAEVSPGNAQANYEIGWTQLVYYGEYHIAEGYLEKAVEADPSLGRAHGSLAIVYWGRRNYEDAIPSFEKAIALETAATRRNAREFLVTVERADASPDFPSGEVVLSGRLRHGETGARDSLQATLAPLSDGEPWSRAGGTIALDTITGKYTVELQGLPSPQDGYVFVGWFNPMPTLSGGTVSTGPLQPGVNGDVRLAQETGWVSGPPIEYFYTLGLAYFYLDECDKAYPVFNAALQINPEEHNAQDGLSYCRAVSQ